MRVPLVDLARLHAPLRAELLDATARVIDSGCFVLGPEVEALERALAARAGIAHAVAVSSGSDALLATLMALGVGPGDEVVTTPLSFIATVEAILRLGARPVFADVTDNLDLDPDLALARVGPRTRLVLPVALFGRRPDLARLAAAGLPVVEDAAQAIDTPGLAHGVHAATLSFFPTKNLGALGDGGMVLTGDGELAERLRRLRVHGTGPRRYVHSLVGGNFRLDALQAALLRVKLPHLDAWTAARRRNARRLREALAAPAARGEVLLPPDDPQHTFHQFVVRISSISEISHSSRLSTPAPVADSSRRDALRAHLAARDIETEIYYPLPLHLQPCLAHLHLGHLGSREGDLPRAEAAARTALALPVHPALDDDQLAHLCAALRAFFA